VIIDASSQNNLEEGKEESVRTSRWHYIGSWPLLEREAGMVTGTKNKRFGQQQQGMEEDETYPICVDRSLRSPERFCDDLGEKCQCCPINSYGRRIKLKTM
jgi:hypothetical protein